MFDVLVKVSEMIENTRFYVIWYSIFPNCGHFDGELGETDFHAQYSQTLEVFTMKSSFFDP